MRALNIPIGVLWGLPTEPVGWKGSFKTFWAIGF